MRTPLVAGNWKMNPPTVADAAQLAFDVADAVKGVVGAEVVVCPPFVALAEVDRAVWGTGVGVAAQNMHPEPKGAFTGEVAASMLGGLCARVVLGHSERRKLFGEDDAFINAKVKAALGASLTPILCVGETLDEREAGRAETVVETQLRGGLDGVEPGDVAGLVVAYEPVWAIGTGRAATADTAQEMIAAVRGVVERVAGAGPAEAVRILYGGSVTPANADELAAQPDVDGALVGGASLVAADFAAIVRAFAARSANG